MLFHCILIFLKINFIIPIYLKESHDCFNYLSNIICQLLLYISLSLLISELVTCLALANEMFTVCDVSKAMNQVCDMGMPLVPFRFSCEEFYPK